MESLNRLVPTYVVLNLLVLKASKGGICPFVVLVEGCIVSDAEVRKLCGCSCRRPNRILVLVFTKCAKYHLPENHTYILYYENAELQLRPQT